MPNYDELLTRLRQPKARFTLAEDDARIVDAGAVQVTTSSRRPRQSFSVLQTHRRSVLTPTQDVEARKVNAPISASRRCV